MSKGLTPDLIAEKVIKTSGGEFSVRGLGSDAITVLVRRCGPELSALFERVVVQGEDGPKLSLDAAAGAAKSLLDLSPSLAAEVIAAAAGPVSDETVGIARALSFPVQLAALEAVAELTFTSDMPPKKVAEIVVRAASGLTSQLAGLKA